MEAANDSTLGYTREIQQLDECSQEKRRILRCPWKRVGLSPPETTIQWT